MRCFSALVFGLLLVLVPARLASAHPGRLTTAVVAARHVGKIDRAFQYDPAGSLVNVLERADRGALADAKPWKVGPGNVLLETPTRKYVNDKRGRRTGERDLTVTEGQERITEYTWDVRDRMREARLPDGKRVVYDYDALGRRIGKRVFEGASPTPARSMAYTWSGPVLVSERSSDRAARNFVHRPGTFEPLLQEERGEVFYIVLDQVGVPRELLDEGGRVAWSGRFSAWGALEEEYVDPYRVQSGKAVTTPFRLLGQIYDEETGLAWTRFRSWDAATGRWMSPDPIGFEGSLNLFAFGGSTLVTTDALGLTGDPHVHPSEVVGRSPQEINDLALSRGLEPRGLDPMAGRGAYVDPANKNSRVVEVHPHDNLGQDPHAHVYNDQDQRLQADGTVAPNSESPEAHLPIRYPP